MSRLSVQNISKAFKRYPSPWSRAAEWLLGGTYHERVWALRDVSFDIPAGSAVGILGVNGAGKSTLLKIITGTTAPTNGAVHVEGRVAALLELGLGFHPEFTGRQNALMSGQMMGMTLSEVQAAMPDIESFAAIGDFIDQPVRTYSSGMQMRLAFSVATAVRPDVLIVDEALSVGDAVFQRKCFYRIEQFQAAGTTLLFVSHDIEAVKRLCDRAVFIHQGEVAHEGSARDVCDAYERLIFGGERESPSGAEMTPQVSPGSNFDSNLAPSCEQVYGNGEAEIMACWLENAGGERINVAATGELLYWCFTVRFCCSVKAPIFAMMLKTADGHAVFGTDSLMLNQTLANVNQGEVLLVRFKFRSNLVPANYYLNCGIRRDDNDGSIFLSRRVDAAILRVGHGTATTALVGPADLGATLSVGHTGA